MKYKIYRLIPKISINVGKRETPGNPDILNNIAWIYATADDPEFQKPKEALMFASMAANLKPAGYILDTLAESFFINGYVEKAIATEEEALEKDPSKANYYRAQLERFKKTGDLSHGIDFDKKQGKNRTN